MKQSIWQDALADVPERGPLIGERKTDVLVVGGGMAGLLTAYMLKKKGIDCLLLEAGRVCSGNTGRTTAKITAQHGLVYAKLIREYGAIAARRFYEANMAAIEAYRTLAEKIPCDCEEKTAYVYSTADRDALEKEAAAYVRLKIPHRWRENPPLPVRSVGALGMPGQAQFHPLKLVRGLLPELDYHENTFVTDIEGHRGRHARRGGDGGAYCARNPLSDGQCSRTLLSQAASEPLLCAGPAGRSGRGRHVY